MRRLAILRPILAAAFICTAVAASGDFFDFPTILSVVRGGTGVATITGIIKGNGTSPFTAAVSGTDYAPATSGTAIQKGNGAGGFSPAVSGTDYAPATSGSVPLKGNGAGGTSAATAADMATLHGGASTPLADGAGAAGSSSNFARDDHRHPSDTTRAAAAITITPSGSLTGGGDLSANRTLTYAGDGAWTTFTPTLNWTTAIPTVSGTSSYAYLQSGTKTYDVRADIVITATGACTAFNCGDVYFTFPNSAVPKVQQPCSIEDNAANVTGYFSDAEPSGIIYNKAGTWAARTYFIKCAAVEVN